MAKRKLGILPNNVNKSPHAQVALIFGTLADGLDEPTVISWLTKAGEMIATLEEPIGRKAADASVTFGLGQRFFARFSGHAANNPHGLMKPPSLPIAPYDADFFLHVSYTSEARLANFLRDLWSTQPTLVSFELERGYARNDGREVFGQRDGLRNLTRQQRGSVTSIHADEFPEEPLWLQGGCYAAYLKIEQNAEAWAALEQGAQEQVIGRRTADGSRLDLPEGENPRTEGEFTNLDTPPVASHVRNAGPRGPVHDENLIFRRGVPYIEELDGHLHQGLQFVSYQSSLDDFDVVLNQWMLNPDFPTAGAGIDTLFASNLVTFLHSGVFVIVPPDESFPAAGYFKGPVQPGRPRKGNIHIRKSAVDMAGNPTQAEVGNIEFQLIDPATGGAIGSPVRTNPAGRATLPKVKIGSTVIVRETTDANSRFQPATDIPVQVTEARQLLPITNQLKPNTPPYGS